MSATTQLIAITLNRIVKGECPSCVYPLKDLPDPACVCKELHYVTRRYGDKIG